MAPNREEVVGSVSPSRRDFLRKVIAGAAFAPPLIASFSLDGLSIAVADAGTSNQFCFVSNATASNMCSEPVILYLHRDKESGQLRLVEEQPTSTTPNFTDSPGLSRSNGNPYVPIGTWQTCPLSLCEVVDVSDLTVWLGLRNSDDQGTSFDLKAELCINGALVASGETICISGVTRNPAKAKAVTISFDTEPGQEFSGVVDLTISARIGTGTCPGHASATGLRLYYDAANRASNFDVELESVASKQPPP